MEPLIYPFPLVPTSPRRSSLQQAGSGDPSQFPAAFAKWLILLLYLLCDDENIWLGLILSILIHHVDNRGIWRCRPLWRLSVALKTMAHIIIDEHCLYWFLKKKTWTDISYLVLFVQGKDLEKALDAFTRAVQIDPENGEAWNNIACLYAHLLYLFLHYYVVAVMASGVLFPYSFTS